MRRVYKLWVVQVPTNRPCIREVLPDRVFPTEEAKFTAIVEEVKRLQGLGRPVLIGTRSVEKSESLSRKLKAADIPPERHPALERGLAMTTDAAVAYALATERS